METLDVTKIEPRLKHPTIFEKFGELKNGESIVIHNDHDPKPLYYQMLAELGEVFTWEYILSGPVIWEVKLKRVTKEEKIATIGEMVAEDFRKAEVFRKFGLDFCCGGKKSVKAACEKKGINYVEVESELKKIEEQNTNNVENYNDWELDFLADYIVNKHHRYVQDAMPMLYEYSNKVARVHGERNPEVVQIARCFNEVAEELTLHMQKEENILFPYIKELVAAKKKNEKIEKPAFGSIKNPINMMEAEHETVGENFEHIRKFSEEYTPPASACNSYRVLYGKLEEFEKDLQQHIHLENNILFKKAIELEQEVLS